MQGGGKCKGVNIKWGGNVKKRGGMEMGDEKLYV